MDKLDMHSPDLVEANIDRLAEIFPTVVSESTDASGGPHRVVDFDLLRQELSAHVVEGPRERYHLDWPGKRAALFAANAPIAKTLRPMREQSDSFDSTRHVFIEGDNLEALKLLQESYLNRVKLIYIDPPYNTGNDFIYRDDFARRRSEYLAASGQTDEVGARLTANPESRGRFHSDWLSMMYPRLKLARNLLAEDGLMFISIDDSEAPRLMQVASEIFGQDNVIASIAWEKRYTRSNNANSFYSVKDTIVVCRRSGAAREVKELRTDESSSIYSNPDGDPRGPWTSSSYVNPATREKRPNLAYAIERPNGDVVEHPTHAWKFSEATHAEHVAEKRLWWGRDGNAQYPRLKVFLSEASPGMVPVDLWSHEQAGTTDAGGREVKELFDGDAVFDFPKPTSLIRKILGIFVPPWDKWSTDFIVLDFFAGSSTTAHAVLEQNAEDGIDRRFIMVQLPEDCPEGSIAAGKGFSTIAELSRERIRRAAQGIVAKTEPNNRTDLDLGFRTFKVDNSNMVDLRRSADDTAQTDLLSDVVSVHRDRSSLDLLFEVMLAWGLNLSLPLESLSLAGAEVISVDEGALVGCFDEDISLEVVRAIAGLLPMRVVFLDSAFASDSDRINADQVFRELSPTTDVKVI